MKRTVMPLHWKLPRKRFKWAVKPSPGPHPARKCIPLAVMIRDVLELATSYREAKKVIKGGGVEVDGRIVRDPKFPLGVYDVVSLTEVGKIFRVVPSRKRFLELREVGGEEADMKIVAIRGKKSVRGGKIQLSCHDGRNILIESGSNEGGYKIGDSLLIRVPEQTIVETLRLEVGQMAIVLGGRDVGRVGTIEEIDSLIRLRGTEEEPGTFLSKREDLIVIGLNPPITVR